MTEDCIFCRIARGDIPADKVYEDDIVLAFRDLNPQAPSHVLVIPRTHIATLNEIDGSNEAVIGRMYGAAREIAEAEGLAEAGFRTVMNCNEAGGQTVFHIHLHLLGGRMMHWPPG
ncbi:MAG: histidine triad nucleotide-binding protein [Gammaproteobacteria bacterium]|nr:histidine triad nucleotide-binding protein [Gammaproteobacteria bacterium]